MESCYRVDRRKGPEPQQYFTHRAQPPSPGADSGCAGLSSVGEPASARARCRARCTRGPFGFNGMRSLLGCMPQHARAGLGRSVVTVRS